MASSKRVLVDLHAASPGMSSSPVTAAVMRAWRCSEKRDTGGRGSDHPVGVAEACASGLDDAFLLSDVGSGIRSDSMSGM